MFPRRKPEPPVNWGEVKRAWDPRAGHLSFVFRSYGIIGQRDSLSGASHMSFWNVLLKGEEAKSYLHLPEVFSGSWPLGGVFCSVPDYFAGAFWRTQIPLWSGRSPLRLSREWLRPLSALLAPGVACLSGHHAEPGWSHSSLKTETGNFFWSIGTDWEG